PSFDCRGEYMTVIGVWKLRSGDELLIVCSMQSNCPAATAALKVASGWEYSSWIACSCRCWLSTNRDAPAKGRIAMTAAVFTGLSAQMAFMVFSNFLAIDLTRPIDARFIRCFQSGCAGSPRRAAKCRHGPGVHLLVVLAKVPIEGRLRR